MIVKKKVNNNVVLAENDDHEEIIVVGRGLGFKKIPYRLTDTELIQHIFVNARNNKILEIFQELPTEHILITEKIIAFGKRTLKKEFNKNILLTLSDHVSFAIERQQDGITFDCPLQFDIQYLYPDEVKIGEVALRMIKTELNIDLPQEEAYSIAMHFINAEHNSSEMKKMYKLTECIMEILSIVENCFTIELNPKSIYYTRFVTHLRYFIFRQLENIQLSDRPNMFLVKSIHEIDEQLQACANEIETFIEREYQWKCSQNEKIYLMIHINFLILYNEK